MTQQLVLAKANAIQTLINNGCKVDKRKKTGDDKSFLTSPRVAIEACNTVREVEWHLRYFLSPEGFR